MYDDTVAGALTVTDPRRYVEVTMRSDGSLSALRIDPHAMYDLTAHELADACLAAIERADSMRSHPGRTGRI
ncbi:hypothetical protein [Micromonospora sp. WMMD1155]|uniref:hypothetical protein n=1 Tax=Micromonospora sp. WMMD1155 TaxID=3016094 RepID=UPI00249B9720|nr:hypothetical protein [Micromonospora sp. WMMD1155]WFE53175.1 hypothetical protein O7617_23930 [Micromonospora sp. WMMD1155]